MTDLRNTIAHILEHKQHLAEANEATIQQYVVLPILRALGWDDVNLTFMEIIPEYQVESRRADYALHIKREQDPVVLIECKRWNQPIGKNEEQICFYAYSGNVPLVVITNGKRWRFYLSRWEASSLSDRIFCETDIEDREAAISDLQKYLLKSNISSGEAKLNAEIALEKKEKTITSEISPPLPNPNPVDDVTDNLSEKRPVTILSESDVEWTIDMVRDSLSPELKAYYDKTYREERTKLFYGAVAGVMNLVSKEAWRLNPAKFSKMLCGFWLTDNGVIGRIRRIFGILPSGRFPTLEIKDKDGELIKRGGIFNPPRIFIRITEEDAKQLKRKYNKCEFCGVGHDKLVDYVYYDIPENMSELLPVLEFAYNKHTGN